MTPVATMTHTSPESHDYNCAFLASSSRWAWRWAVLTHATLLAMDTICSTNYRVQQYTMALSVLEETLQSHSMSCWTISLSTSAISSTTYSIRGSTVDIRTTTNLANITILRSVSWKGDREAVNAMSYHPRPTTTIGASWRVWNLTTANALHPRWCNEAFANGSLYARVPRTWEWLHVPSIRTRWTEDRQTWLCPCHRSRVVSRLGSRLLYVRCRGSSEAPPRWRCERWPSAGSWTWPICRVRWAWPPKNQAYFRGPTSRPSLVPCTSTVRGPVDEKLTENALCAFDPRAVAARPVEGQSVWSNTREMRGEMRTGIAMDNGHWVGRRLQESQWSNYRLKGFGLGSGRVATSDAMPRRPIYTCTFVDCPWIYDR